MAQFGTPSNHERVDEKRVLEQAGQARWASGRDQPNVAVSSRIKRIRIPLYHFYYCFQCVADGNTKFLDSPDQPDLTYCK
jgi:hypothetical protein